jgi:hypothetical protein
MLLLLLRGLMIRPLLLPVPVGALLAAAVLATATAVVVVLSPRSFSPDISAPHGL